MRRAVRRSLLTCVTVLLAGAIASPQAAALFVPDHGAARPILVAAKAKRLTPKERAAEAGRKKHEANAKFSHVWILGRDGTRPALSYARANGDDVKVSLSCEAEAGLVRVIVYDIPAKTMKPGDGGRVRLSNGPARVEVAATALPNEKNSRAVDLGGVTKVSPRLFSLIKSGDTMVVEVPGRTTGVPLKTLGAKAEAFERACLARR